MKKKSVRFNNRTIYPYSKAEKEAFYQKRKRINLERQNKLKKKLSKFKIKYGCYICKEMEQCCLSFHHKDPSTKDFDISSAIKKNYSEKLIWNEILKCIILCENCHRKVHAGVLELKIIENSEPTSLKKVKNSFEVESKYDIYNNTYINNNLNNISFLEDIEDLLETDKE